MVESTNTNRCPNGTYLGWWGGYKCHVIISGTKYEWDTSEGVRGFNCRQIIKVTGGKASFDPSETWEPNQVPELDFKYIKVVYTIHTTLGLEILSKTVKVPLRWKYTVVAEDKLAEELGIHVDSIINILNYEE